jgi:hypothetical protein
LVAVAVVVVVGVVVALAVTGMTVVALVGVLVLSVVVMTAAVAMAAMAAAVVGRVMVNLAENQGVQDLHSFLQCEGRPSPPQKVHQLNSLFSQEIHSRQPICDGIG